MEKEALLTIEEIQALDVDADIIREAISKAEIQLADLISNFTLLDKKANSYLIGYGTLAASAAALSKITGFNEMALISTSVIFLCGSIFATLSMSGLKCPLLGTHPSFWLSASSYINGEVSREKMLAYLLRYQADTIDELISLNQKKASRLALVEWTAPIAILVSLIIMLIL